MSKYVNGRISHKHDSQANWEKATNFIPNSGELIVYDADENFNHPRLKIGDNQTNVNDLPFVEEETYINVAALPEETDVNDKIAYRVLEGTFVGQKRFRYDATCHTVNWKSLPTESGESALTYDGEQGGFSYEGYYNIADNEAYAYVNSDTKNALAEAAKKSGISNAVMSLFNGYLETRLKDGWKTFGAFIADIENIYKEVSFLPGVDVKCPIAWGGVVFDVASITEDKKVYIFVGAKTYYRNNGVWTSGDFTIGRRGTDSDAEVFNDLNNIASAPYAHAEGSLVVASGSYSHAEGYRTEASGLGAHAEGQDTCATGQDAHAEGNSTTSSGTASHTEGVNTQATTWGAHAEGGATQATNEYAHAEGYNTEATAHYAHAEGNGTTASGTAAHSEGNNTEASGTGSHAEGVGTHATGYGSHAEGTGTTASAEYAHAEGVNAQATGNYSHAEGHGTSATHIRSHAEGHNTVAKADAAHAGGKGTIAAGIAQTAIGSYNEENTSALLVVGYGTADTDRKNAFVVNSDGSASIAKVGGTSDSVINRAYLSEALANVGGVGQRTEEGGEIFNEANSAGYMAHAEGNGSAPGGYAHAEGYVSIASGYGSHAEGMGTAEGTYAHAEGETKAIGQFSHAEGYLSHTYGMASHAENWSTAYGPFSHTEGSGQTGIEGFIVQSFSRHISGGTSLVLDSVEGISISDRVQLYAVEGPGISKKLADWLPQVTEVDVDNKTIIIDTSYSDHAWPTDPSSQLYVHNSSNPDAGKLIPVGCEYSHSEGYGTFSTGEASHAEGKGTRVLSGASHAEGGATCSGGAKMFKVLNMTHNSYNREIFLDSVEQLKIGDYLKIYISSPFGHITSSAEYTPVCIESIDSQNRSIITDYTPTMNIDDVDGGFLYPRFALNLSNPQSGTIYIGRSYDANAHAEGEYTIASGQASHAEGKYTVADGQYTHASGYGTIATANYQTAIGYQNALDKNALFIVGNGFEERSNAFTVNKDGTATVAVVGENDNNVATVGYVKANAGGVGKKVYADNGDAKGEIFNDYTNNKATGGFTHAEGYNTEATSWAGHAEGGLTKSHAPYSHAEGLNTYTAGEASHTEGQNSVASGSASHAEGYNTEASGVRAHAEGSGSKASNAYAHAEGNGSEASGNTSHAEGHESKATAYYAHAQNLQTIASGIASHAEGEYSKAAAEASHAEGIRGIAGYQDRLILGVLDHQISTYKTLRLSSIDRLSAGQQLTLMFGNQKFYCEIIEVNTKEESQSETDLCVVEVPSENLEQLKTVIEENLYKKYCYVYVESEETFKKNGGTAAHTEGVDTLALAYAAHAEGSQTYAQGFAAHAEGSDTSAVGHYSHAGGLGTIAMGAAQTVVGKYNTKNSEALFVVGNGSGEKVYDENGALTGDGRSNAFTVNRDGSANFFGYIKLQRGVHYGTESEIPADFPEGGLWFKVV